MNLNKTTALALRAGSYIGILIILVGLVMYCLDMGDKVLWLGTLVLIASPFIGVVAAFLSLVSEKDWRWVAVALILIAITVIGLLLSV